MDVGDIRKYQQRWKAVRKIERAEQISASPQQNWQQLNALARRAALLGIDPNSDIEEMIIFMRWAR